MTISEAKKKEGRFCCAYGCKNEPVKRKGGLCHKHFYRKRRKSDPVGCRYTQFKANAKKRNIGFYVSLSEFRSFCQRNKYIVVKGRRGQNATIDRRCNIHGYFIWNMQIISNIANASKGGGFRGDEFECPF